MQLLCGVSSVVRRRLQMTRKYWVNDIDGFDAAEGVIDPNATFDASRLAAAMQTRINRYADHVMVTGKADRWRRSANLAYGVDPDSARRSTDVTFAGDAGNITALRTNMYRRLAEATHVLVTGSRPAFKSAVSSSDSEAVDAIPIADELLDHALTRLGGEDAAARAAWNAYIYSEGHMSVRWNEHVGDALDADGEGRLMRSGDVIVMAHRPDEVVRDPRLGEQTQNDWIILRTEVNRWDLADLYPAFADKILDTNRRDELDDVRESLVYGVSDIDQGDNGDMVGVYELFHRATPAVPKGRYALMVGDTIVAVGPNKYGDIPIYSMIPDKEPGQPFGYSSGWDLMAMQQALDSTLTSMVSTTENLGQPGLWAGPGGAVGVDNIKGFAWLQAPQKPEPVQYVTPETLAVLQTAMAALVEFMTQNSGLNAVALGDAGKSASGDALAMMHSLAIQSTSRLQAAYATMFAAAMLGVIRRYRTFATDERMISITGKGSKARVKRWTGASLASIDSIKVEMRAAIMRTATGRQQVAKEWAQLGLITNPEQYMQVMTTGSLTPVTDRPLTERALIEHENEALMEGEVPQVAPTHNHPLHIQEHSIGLLDPDVIADPLKSKAHADHIQWHVEQWSQISMAQPDLLMALNIPPAPSAAMMQAAMAAQPPEGDEVNKNAPQGKPEPSPPNQAAQLEEANVPPGGGMDAGGGNPNLTGGGRLPAGTGEPVMA
jgi:hypothetical protein